MLLDDYLKLYSDYLSKYGERIVLFMQVGGFYEAYSLDNKSPDLSQLSDTLNIVYTRKDKNKNDSPFMLGFPTQAIHKFVRLLIQKNFTVILYRQIIDDNPGSINRDLITRNLEAIYTPSTYIEDNVSSTNYMIGVYLETSGFKNDINYHLSLTIVDITTGDLMFTENHFKSFESLLTYLNNINQEIQPKEYVVYRLVPGTNNFNEKENNLSDTISQHISGSGKKSTIFQITNNSIEKISYQTEFFSRIYKNSNLHIFDYLDLSQYNFARISLLLTLDFCYQLNDKIINFIKRPKLYHQNSLVLGNNAISQLNIIDNNNLSMLNNEYKSVYDVVNLCNTSMGKRFLYKRLISPDVDKDKINCYYNFSNDVISKKDKLTSILKNIKDIERIGRKIMMNNCSPTELYNYYYSCNEIESLVSLCDTQLLNKLLQYNGIDYSLDEVIIKLKSYLQFVNNNFVVDELNGYNNLKDIKTNIIRGDKELDKLQICLNNDESIYERTRQYFSRLLNEKKDVKLEIKDNKDGKHIFTTLIRGDKIQKALKSENPNEVEKYTFHMMNKSCKIYINDVGSTDYNSVVELFLNTLRKKYFSLLEQMNEYFSYFYAFNTIVAIVDFSVNNCNLMEKYGYCKPEIKDDSKIAVKQLRHPLIEKLIDTEYIPNDLDLNRDPYILLFGINASGKSSLQKSLGISLILAQAGIYVPAKSYVYSPYKKLYVRIMGNDNIFKGQSSFVVEMAELKAILENTGDSTLVISDEMARGSETTSSISIVASAIISLVDSKTNFITATHFNEILNFEEVKELPLSIYHLSIEVENGTIVYGRKMLPGRCIDNYGVMVAASIIKDTKFLKNTQKFSRNLNDQKTNILNDKKSRYNKDVYVDECSICGAINELETHHIHQQKDSDKYKVLDKEHIGRNSKANLIVLCEECHDKVHRDNVKILKNITTEGIKVELK